jgi:hypothetical protein
MKLSLKINGNPVEVDVEPFNMGEMEDHQEDVNALLSRVTESNPQVTFERVRLAGNVISDVIAKRFPQYSVEDVRRALPYGSMFKILTALVTGNEGNAESPSTTPTTGASA